MASRSSAPDAAGSNQAYDSIAADTYLHGPPAGPDDAARADLAEGAAAAEVAAAVPPTAAEAAAAGVDVAEVAAAAGSDVAGAATTGTPVAEATAAAADQHDGPGPSNAVASAPIKIPAGYYPGLEPIMPDKSCPVCLQSLELHAPTSAKGTRLDRVYCNHIFDCARKNAHAVALASLVARYGHESLQMFIHGYDCIVCGHANTNTREGRGAYKHIRRHVSGATADTFTCLLCRKPVAMTLEATVAHSAIRHSTWLISATVDAVTEGVLQLEHFRALVPYYDNDTKEFVCDPLEVDKLMQENLNEIIADRAKVTRPLDRRTDIRWPATEGGGWFPPLLLGGRAVRTA